MEKQVNIPLSATKEVCCPKCGQLTFESLFTLRFYPGGILSPVPIYINQQVFCCAACGELIDQQNPHFNSNENEKSSS